MSVNGSAVYKEIKQCSIDTPQVKRLLYGEMTRREILDMLELCNHIRLSDEHANSENHYVLVLMYTKTIHIAVEKAKYFRSESHYHNCPL